MALIFLSILSFFSLFLWLFFLTIHSLSITHIVGIFFYSLTAIYFLNKSKPDSNAWYYIIYLILMVLLILGFIRKPESLQPFLSFIELVAYFYIAIYIAKKNAGVTLIFILWTSFSMLIFIIIIYTVNLLVLNGNPLETIVQIQTPVIIYSGLYVYSQAVTMGLKYERRYSKLLIITSLVFYMISMYQGNEVGIHRLQYLPTTLIILTIIYYFLFLRKNGMKIYFWRILFIISLGFTVYYIYDPVKFIDNRMTGLQIRLELIYIMMIESYYYFVPGGLSSSLKWYDVSDGVSRLINRKYFYPHSGFAIILYEFGIFIIPFVFFIKRILLQQVVYSMNAEIKWYMFHVLPSYHRISRTQLYFLFIFWFIENLMYIKGVPSAELFASDSLLIFILIYLHSLKIKTFQSIKTI
jgi:hypothetical protein